MEKPLIDRLADALNACLEKGKRWHPCDEVVVNANAILNEYENRKEVEPDAAEVLRDWMKAEDMNPFIRSAYTKMYASAKKKARGVLSRIDGKEPK